MLNEDTERFNAFYDREILKADVTNPYEIAVKAYQEGIKQGRHQEQIDELNRQNEQLNLQIQQARLTHLGAERIFTLQDEF